MKTQLLALTFAAAIAASLQAAPVGTAFTYQGKLNDGGVPATGLYDITFKLLDGPVSPPAAQLGSDYSLVKVPVTNGLFTVKLDFGAAYFKGDARWLEIWANTNNQAVVKLDPRQELTPTPYAIFAGTAAGVTNQGITTTMIAPGAVGAPQLGAAGSPASGQVLTFNGSGLVWTTPAGSAPAWLLGGNAGTTPGTDFLGTTDNKALEIKVNGARALRIDPAGGAPNLTGGALDNYIDSSGVRDSVIAGGSSNSITSGAWWSAIGGGSGNEADAWYSALGGGNLNRIGASGGYSAISGGNHNFIGGPSGFLGAGTSNTIFAGANDFLGGGSQNYISTNDYAVLVGGVGNSSSGYWSFLGGGQRNQNFGWWAVLGGGETNFVLGDHAVLNGGAGNNANGSYAVVGGGAINLAGGNYAVTAGGYNNNGSASQSTVGGGKGNWAGGVSATVAGGENNIARGLQSVVAGGTANAATASFATVGGGIENYAGTDGATIGGGEFNTNLTVYGTIGGGALNYAAANYSTTIAGGYQNTVRGQDGTIGGGSYNLAQASFSGIASGQYNYVGTNLYDTIEFGVITNYGNYSAILGGTYNRISSLYSGIGGGYNNLLYGDYGEIGGGYGNQIGYPSYYSSSYNASTIAGGSGNRAYAAGGVIAGGVNNQVNGNQPAILGGSNNIVWSSYSVVLGGLNNEAGTNNLTGNYALAAGRRAKARHIGSFVWGDSTDDDIVSTNANSMTFRATGGVRIYSYVDPTHILADVGVRLAPGSGSWSSMSDRNAKQCFQAVDKRQILEKVAAMPISTWRYNGEDSSIHHLGPTAQDFKAAFALGDSDKSITTVDADGVALAAIQGLTEIVHERDSELHQLQQTVTELKHRLDALNSSK